MRNLKSRILTVDLYLSDEEYAILKKLVEEQRRSGTAEVLASKQYPGSLMPLVP